MLHQLRKPSCFRLRWLALGLIAIQFLESDVSVAQVLQYKKDSERFVRRYERLVAKGALLTPEGWAGISAMFERSAPFPANSDIEIITGPGIIGETSRDGDRARVETKWGDYCGTVDSHLRYQAPATDGCIMTGESFNLVFVRRNKSGEQSQVTSESGEWKIEAPKVRVAGVSASIRYLEARREKSNDPIIRKNADRTIKALRHLSSGCGRPNAC